MEYNSIKEMDVACFGLNSLRQEKLNSVHIAPKSICYDEVNFRGYLRYIDLINLNSSKSSKDINNERDILSIGLSGNLRLKFQSKVIVSLDGKCMALLAILATSRDMRRSRNWLKSVLWEESDEKHASNSLRQLLFIARKQLGKASEVIKANRTHVWLENTQLEEYYSRGSQPIFFEDAPFIGENFEDWRLNEQALFENACRENLEFPLTISARKNKEPGPKVIILNQPKILNDDFIAEIFADQLHTTLFNVICATGYVEVVDGMSPICNQPSSKQNVQLSNVTFVIDTKISLAKNKLCIGINLIYPSTRRVISSRSFQRDLDKEPEIAPEELAEFTVNVVDVFLNAIHRNAFVPKTDDNLELDIYSAVIGLFRMSKAGVIESLDLLRRSSDAMPSAMALAWQGFGTMLLSGEMLISERQAARDEAEALLCHALEHDSSDGVVLAVAAQFQSFVLRNSERAEQLLEAAVCAAPYSAFVWDTVAMHNLYKNDIENGAVAANRARRFGRFCPFRFYYDASSVVASTLQGKHQDAVNIARLVLAQRPNFLPVMRHASASLTELGKINEATQLVDRTRKIDPLFATDAMIENTYPLPSSMSRQIITKSLSKINLINR